MGQCSLTGSFPLRFYLTMSSFQAPHLVRRAEILLNLLWCKRNGDMGEVRRMENGNAGRSRARWLWFGAVARPLGDKLL